MAECLNIQKSLGWCQGTPELPGVKRRIYYISKGDIVEWPTLPRDNNGRITAAVYDGRRTFVNGKDGTRYYAADPGAGHPDGRF